MFKVASLNGNGANQTLLSMNNLVEGNIHGGIIDNTTGTKQNVTFIVGTVEFPLSVDANGTTPVSKINVPSDTTVQVNAPIGVNVSISYIETAADASAALTTIQGLVSEADTSATNAGISETNANNSAISANLSAENANESETNASNSEIMANKWAVNPENTEVLTGQFSAYHWARKAQAVASGDVIDDGVVSDLLTWSSEKISEKIDEKTLNINNLPDKPIPDDTDNFVLQEVGGLLKKLSFANLMALIKSFSFGWGQTWQDVIAYRSSGVTYTNTTGKSIQVICGHNSNGGGSPAWQIDGVSWNAPTNINGVGVTSTMCFIVPNGSTYKYTGVISVWKELR